VPLELSVQNMGILEKIADIEREIAKTQKNKATEYHLGLLKAKLAKYRVSTRRSWVYFGYFQQF
jgi:ribosome-interacting GTPase 1